MTTKSTQSITEFRARMWATFRANAKGKTGQQVVDALERASEKTYAAGIDHAYAGGKLNADLAEAFDLTWLTAVNIELTPRAK